MNFAKPTENPEFFQNIFHVFRLKSSFSDNDIDILTQIVQRYRPKKITNDTLISISDLLDYLKENESDKKLLILHLQLLFSKRRFTSILSDSGIIKDTHFFREVKERLVAKILPNQPGKDTLEYVLNQVFYKSSDHFWIDKINISELQSLFNILEFSTIYSENESKIPINEVLKAMNLITQRISGRALEQDVLRMIPEFENMESPFEAYEKQLDLIDAAIRSTDEHSILSNDPLCIKLQEIFSSCHELIDKAFNNSAVYGISLTVNQNLLRIQQQLNRLGKLMPLLIVDIESEKTSNSVHLAVKLIRYNCRKNNVRKLFKDSTQNIAYEITKHTAKTGEHYITESRREYFHMLYTAMGGGFLVGIMCVIKLMLTDVHVSDFGHALFYSLNYSIGFVVIYLLGFTLATKQPAMTAAAIVKSIEKGLKQSENEKDRHLAFAQLFSRLFRSQFIAFVGNLIIVFPVSLGIVLLADYLFTFNLAENRSVVLLNDLSPIHSLALFHAAIAGVFLFLSGIISGAVSNRHKHNKIYYRIAEHPLLKLSFGKEKTQRIANWFEHKWAGVSSNIWFGVFMGSTSIIGAFLGLNLDIRHITFAGGNMALGLYGAHFIVEPFVLFWGIIGIGLIGFMNFIVSFLLSLGVAFRSRDIPSTEVRFLFKSVWTYFKKRPFSFFIPLKDSNL
jgi:site-specific recombinase